MMATSAKEEAIQVVAGLSSLDTAEFVKKVTLWVYSKGTPGSKPQQYWILRLLSEDPRVPRRVQLLMLVAAAYKSVESSDVSLAEETPPLLEYVIETSWALPMSDTVMRENGIALRFSALRAMIHVFLACERVPEALATGRRAVRDFAILDESHVRRPWFGAAPLAPAFCAAIGILEAIDAQDKEGFSAAWQAIQRAMIEGFCVRSDDRTVALEYLEGARVYNFVADLDRHLRILDRRPSLDAFVPSQLLGLLRLSLRNEDLLARESLVGVWRNYLIGRGVEFDADGD